MSITLTTVILFAVFGVLLFLGVPISISIVVSSIVTAMSTLSWDQITFITMQKMNSGVESFSLLAVPLFILAGNIMNNGGIAKRLVNFAQLFVGKIPGSMAQANILGNMLFGALSGSSVAAASAMGGCISPIEEENGYDPAYSAAANIASAPTGGSINYAAIPEIVTDSIAVDAACSGNPGRMEYRGVDVKSGIELFRVGPFEHGTNNVGEFLAIVHALALLQQQGRGNVPIYSDSRVGQLWVRGGKCKTKLTRTAANARLHDVVARAERWLATHTYTNPILKWQTDKWGEIPADFGRK